MQEKGSSVAGVCHRSNKLNSADLTATPAVGSPDCFSSMHPGGAHFLLGDGAVRFIGENIDVTTYEHLGSKADGTVISNF